MVCVESGPCSALLGAGPSTGPCAQLGLRYHGLQCARIKNISFSALTAEVTDLRCSAITRKLAEFKSAVFWGRLSLVRPQEGLGLKTSRRHDLAWMATLTLARYPCPTGAYPADMVVDAHRR